MSFGSFCTKVTLCFCLFLFCFVCLFVCFVLFLGQLVPATKTADS